MYPGTKINWYDESQIGVTEIEAVDNRPLFLMASSFDKGPEALTRVNGESFYDLYGTNISFTKHGQAAIEAAAIIDAGGELLMKRVVADDATLANIVFLATLSTSTTQATDDEGNLLYLDDEGNQTTTVTETIVVDSTSTSITWSAVSIENCYSRDEVIEQAAALADEDAGTYPILVICDNGRGDSNKAFRIALNSEISVSVGVPFYTVYSYEGTNRIEYTTATIYSCLYADKNYGLEKYTMEQLQCYVDEDMWDSFVSAIADSLGTDTSTVKTYDLISGTTVKGAAIDGLTISTDSIDLTATYGVELSGGSNGEFGTAPVDTDAWTEALIEFYSGEYTNEIYDLDEFKIAFCPDANYPYEVKDAIAELVTFREDCVFLRDMRFDVTNYLTCVTVLEDKFDTGNRFIANYLTWYQIYDPLTKRRIKVTMLYDMVKCLVSAYNVGIHVPTAGIANGFILESAIEGTVNFVPRITPDTNQKQLLDDLRVNYAVFMQGQCVVQSLYTSQEAYTQLSYLNNVMAIQNVVRSVRTSCPKKRYTFVDDSDFSEYAEHVQTILKNFKTDFDTLTFVYTKDSLLSQQKIFYASIKFAFKDWAQSEIFDVYAISNTAADTDSE